MFTLSSLHFYSSFCSNCIFKKNCMKKWSLRKDWKSSTWRKVFLGVCWWPMGCNNTTLSSYTVFSTWTSWQLAQNRKWLIWFHRWEGRVEAEVKKNYIQGVYNISTKRKQVSSFSYAPDQSVFAHYLCSFPYKVPATYRIPNSSAEQW